MKNIILAALIAAHTIAAAQPRPAQEARTAPEIKLAQRIESPGCWRYERVRAAVLLGQLAPTAKTVRSATGCDAALARAHVERLGREGVKP